jgi:Arc/MetJ family transcription regulator
MLKTTVHLDEQLVARVRRFVAPRRFNRFVNDTLAEKLAALERDELERELREGYLATRVERAELNADWGAIETEGWPD